MIKLKLKKNTNAELIEELKQKLERNNMRIIETNDVGEYIEIIAKEVRVI